jgi:Raf kinase inhibitor-like YbhB/YbcL family protein
MARAITGDPFVTKKSVVFTSVGVLLLLSIASLHCTGKEASAPPPEQAPAQATSRELPEQDPKFELTSPTIVHRAALPATHTCDGAGTSPELNWSAPPEGVASLVLIMIDPDVPGNFTHWVLYNLPPDIRSLPAGLPGDPVLASLGGARQGPNSFGKTGWGGPCPPAGAAHRYIFRLYAIDTMLDVPPDADRLQLEDAMKGHYRAQTALIASYARAE